MNHILPAFETIYDFLLDANGIAFWLLPLLLAVVLKLFQSRKKFLLLEDLKSQGLTQTPSHSSDE